MQEELVSFQVAKLAKEKGLCNYFENINPTKYVPAFYSEDNINFDEVEFQQEDCTIDDRYFRPTQSLLQRWLREVHNIHIDIRMIEDEEDYEKITWAFQVITKNSFGDVEYGDFNSYEEALEKGLIKALKELS